MILQKFTSDLYTDTDDAIDTGIWIFKQRCGDGIKEEKRNI